MSNAARPFVADVDDVVGARVRVGLDAELRSAQKEWIDVERGDVELDQRVGRQHELRGLEAAVRRVAVGELPLLARSPAPGAASRRRVGLPAGTAARPLAAAGAVLSSSYVPNAGEEEHGDGRDDDPDRLDARVAADRRAVAELAGAAPRNAIERVAEEEERRRADDRRRRRRSSTVLSNTWPDASALPLPGREMRRRGRSRRAASRSRSRRAKDQRRGGRSRPRRRRSLGALIARRH